PGGVARADRRAAPRGSAASGSAQGVGRAGAQRRPPHPAAPAACGTSGVPVAGEGAAAGQAGPQRRVRGHRHHCQSRTEADRGADPRRQELRAMSSSPSTKPRARHTIALLGAAAVVVGLAVWLLFRDVNKAKPADNPAPAKATAVKEAELNVIKLTRKAEQRLGLTTGIVKRQERRQYRTVGGEVMAVPGRDVIVVAPLAGRLQAPPKGVPTAGQKVERKQPVFQLVPILTPDSRTTLITARVEVEGTLKGAQTEKEAARVALNRAETLLRDQAGSRRGVDEAQAKFDLAS